MTDKQNNPDPIAHAARLLREAAEELRQAHAFPGIEGWENETDAKAAYDEHMAAAQALEDWEEAIGAGGVSGPLVGKPQEMPYWMQYDERNDVLTINGKRYAAGMFGADGFLSPPGTWLRVCVGAEDCVTLSRASLAASPTPPAEQQAITPETGNSVSAQGAAITSESGAVYAELPDFDSGDEPIWEAIFKWANATPGSDAHKKADAVSGAIINALRDFADRTHAKRASHGQAPAPLQRLHDLLYAAQRQTSRDAMHGAITAARIELSKLMAAPKAAPGAQNTVPAEWLEQAYREGWAACRDAETIGEEAEDWAFGNSTANSRMIDAQQAAPQQEAQEPALFVSAKQLADLVDPSHATGGSYLPARKTRAGLFTQPLYTAPQPAPAPLSDDLLEALQEIVEDLEQGAIPNANDPWWRKARDAITAALAKQGGK